MFAMGYPQLVQDVLVDEYQRIIKARALYMRQEDTSREAAALMEFASQHQNSSLQVCEHGKTGLDLTSSKYSYLNH